MIGFFDSAIFPNQEVRAITPRARNYYWGLGGLKNNITFSEKCEVKPGGDPRNPINPTVFLSQIFKTYLDDTKSYGERMYKKVSPTTPL